MPREGFHKQIKDRILASQPGSIFVSADFNDITDRDTVKKSLLRLCDENIVRRVLRGLYERPEYSEFLSEYIATDPHKAAWALARNFGWTIAPSGNTALNLLNLSPQVSATLTYVSDGPYKTYRLNSTFLVFKHTANKELAGMSERSALVVQALKVMGNRDLDDVIERLRATLTDAEKAALLSETRYATSWIYEAIKKIAAPDRENA